MIKNYKPKQDANKNNNNDDARLLNNQSYYVDDDEVSMHSLERYYERKKTINTKSKNVQIQLPPVPIIPQKIQAPQKIPSVEEIEEADFWNGFEAGSVVVFCFRKPCTKTRSFCLNKLALVASNYIHVEICIYNTEGTMTRSLFITDQVKTVKFAQHVLTDTDPVTGARTWDFLWFQLNTLEQVSQMKRTVYRLAHYRRPRRFSHCNIYCFYCFACCCCASSRPSTATCTSLTMEFIRDVWSKENFTIADNLFSYTPDDVFEFIHQRSERMNVLNFDNANPTVSQLIKK